MIEKTVIYNNVTKQEEIVEVELTQEEAEKREKMNALFENNELLQEAKMYLNETDYVIIKMYESFVQGDSVLEMLSEYKDVLAKRKNARKKINELETKL